MCTVRVIILSLVSSELFALGTKATRLLHVQAFWLGGRTSRRGCRWVGHLRRGYSAPFWSLSPESESSSLLWALAPRMTFHSDPNMTRGWQKRSWPATGGSGAIPHNSSAFLGSAGRNGAHVQGYSTFSGSSLSLGHSFLPLFVRIILYPQPQGPGSRKPYPMVFIPSLGISNSCASLVAALTIQYSR